MSCSIEQHSNSNQGYKLLLKCFSFSFFLWRVSVILYLCQLFSHLSYVDWMLSDSCLPRGVENVFVYKYYDLSDWGVPNHRRTFLCRLCTFSVVLVCSLDLFYRLINKNGSSHAVPNTVCINRLLSQHYEITVTVSKHVGNNSYSLWKLQEEIVQTALFITRWSQMFHPYYYYYYKKTCVRTQTDDLCQLNCE